MDVVLLGATGFVGRAVLEELLAAAWVRSLRILVRNPSSLAVDHPKLTIVQGSLPDFPDELLPRDEDYSVIHFASIQRSANALELSVNQRGIEQIFSRAGTNLRGFLFGSSMSVHGQGPQRGIDGSAPPNPETPLAESRFACEEIVRKAAIGRGIGYANLRPRFILDVDDPSTMGPWIKLAQKGILLGDGQQRFTIIARSDYAKIVTQLAASFREGECPVRGALVVGYHQPLVYGEIFRGIRQLLGFDPKPKFRVPALPWLLTLMHKTKALAGAAVKMELMGYDHYGDSRALRAFVDHELLEQDPREVALGLAKSSLKSTQTSSKGNI